MTNPEPATTAEVVTPALVVDESVFKANCAAMDAVRPGLALRPHVKAFKSTAIAKRLAADGHTAFCAATPREVEGLANAGLGADLLLANESLDVARLGALEANVTVAVDSDAVLDVAVAGGIRSVLIDIDVGLPRCGCDVETGARLAERARKAGLDVRGVMGYEGHLMMVPERADRIGQVDEAMSILLEAHDRIGGDVVSGGGTGTFDTNTSCTEIQAGSYTLMDADYGKQSDLPFEQALCVVATVISVSAKGWFVADAGLKAFGMDHGPPTFMGAGDLFFCSDEHATVIPENLADFAVGDRVAFRVPHIDPTVARHQQFWVTAGGDPTNTAITDCWPIDLRHW